MLRMLRIVSVCLFDVACVVYRMSVCVCICILCLWCIS